MLTGKINEIREKKVATATPRLNTATFEKLFLWASEKKRGSGSGDYILERVRIGKK